MMFFEKCHGTLLPGRRRCASGGRCPLCGLSGQLERRMVQLCHAVVSRSSCAGSEQSVSNGAGAIVIRRWPTPGTIMWTRFEMNEASSCPICGPIRPVSFA